MRGEEWVIGISLAEKLMLRDTVQVDEGTKTTPVKMFASVHKNTPDIRTKELSGDYLMSLDGNRLQIYISNGKDRSNTFLCLWDMLDGYAGMSVALDKFHSSFPKQHNARLRREEVRSVEVFFRHATPYLAPSLYYHPDIKDNWADMLDDDSNDLLQDAKGRASFELDHKHFPLLGDDPPPEITSMEQAHRELYDHRKKLLQIDRGMATAEDISPLIALFSAVPEVSITSQSRHTVTCKIFMIILEFTSKYCQHSSYF